MGILNKAELIRREIKFQTPVAAFIFIPLIKNEVNCDSETNEVAIACRTRHEISRDLRVRN